MKRKIIFWHGKEQSLEEKVKLICTLVDGNYFYEGSLEDFEKVFPRFIVMNSDGESYLGITQHNGFGQR